MEYYYGNSSYNNSSEAINFELFERKSEKDEEYYQKRRERERERIREEQRKKARAKENLRTAISGAVRTADRARAVKLVAAVLMGLAIITTLVMSSAQNYDLMLEINEKEKELASLQHEYEALTVQFDTKMSNTAVEEYATRELGMQKRENSQTEWIDIGGGDVFEYTAGRSVLVRLRDWLVGLGA